MIEVKLAAPENFSYTYAKCLYIPINQQMIVYQNVTIDNEILIDGELVILD
jgi:hypothetical protein